MTLAILGVVLILSLAGLVLSSTRRLQIRDNWFDNHMTKHERKRLVKMIDLYIVLFSILSFGCIAIIVFITFVLPGMK